MNNSTAIVRALIVSISALALTVGSTSAQQTTGTPGSPGVDDNDYQVPFRFTGKLDKLTIKLVPLNAEEERLFQQKRQDTKNKAQ